MFATEFIFNGHSSAEYGITICGFDGSDTSISGGEIEVNSVQPPSSYTFDYYGRTMPNPITWTFSVCKVPCEVEDNEYYFSIDEQRHIAKWLLGEPGYKPFCIPSDDEDIYYFCTANMTPHMIGNDVGGFDITITSNSGIGFSYELARIDSFTDGKKGKTIQIQVNNDIKVPIYPEIKIIGSGDFEIVNTNISGDVISRSVFKNITNELILDCANDIIQGLNKATDFNYEFPILHDGINNLTCTNPDVQIQIKYREIRKVIVL